MTQEARPVLHPFYGYVRGQASLSPKPFPALIPVVLAAGASARMGRRKELLEFQGVTCLELALRACAVAGLGQPLVVTRAERRAELGALLAARGWDIELVINPAPELGQTSSLRAGLAALPSGCRAFVIYPVDHPLITGADVARLAVAFTEAVPPVAVVAPSFQRRRGHPVIVDAALAPALLALAPGGSAREVLAPTAVATAFVAFDDDRVLLDMDTPEAYQEAQRRYRAPT
jgi:molybdenum cofactor cytidylyltransferase